MELQSMGIKTVVGTEIWARAGSNEMCKRPVVHYTISNFK
jgi:hypothetical protein